MRDARFFGMDDTKLHLHPGRVSSWQLHGDCAPIYAEVSPTSACNQRCTFCALDFTGHKPQMIDPQVLATALHDAASLGLRSVMFGGEGEPGLHPGLAGIIRDARHEGLSVGVTTNGTSLTREAIEECSCCVWVKVSVDAGTPSVYRELHRASAHQWDALWENVGNLVACSKAQRDGADIGIQTLLLPDNVETIPALAQRARASGAAYLVIKPHSQHPSTKELRYAHLEPFYEELGSRVREATEAYSTESFRVVWRAAAIRRRREGLATPRFDRCRALSFWFYLDTMGDAWACSCWTPDQRWSLGNIYSQGFADIWNGPKRRELMRYVREELDVSACRIGCRAEQDNRYLDRLEHPEKHDAFL